MRRVTLLALALLAGAASAQGYLPESRSYSLAAVPCEAGEDCTLDALTATSVDSTAASGGYGFRLLTTGARLDLGAGANDYLSSDGVGVLAAGRLIVAGEFSAASYITNGSTDQPVRVDDADGFSINSTTAITHHYVAEVTLDFPNMSTLRAETLTGSVTGARTGDAVSVTPQCAIAETLIIANARVTDSDTVSLSVFNGDGSDYDPPSCTFTFDVRRKAP